jgi:hypothetical protein
VLPGEHRFDLDELKKEIEQEIHSNEHVEDEEGFRFIGQQIILASRFMAEINATARMEVKRALTAIFCPSRCKMLLLFFSGQSIHFFLFVHDE